MNSDDLTANNLASSYGDLFIQKFINYGWIIGVLLCGLWIYAILGIDSDKHQGEVYRILYIHVPCALIAFAMAFCLFTQGVYSLIRPDSDGILAGKVFAEIGVIFTVFTLITGSIWGRPTWGVWWTWDARLTTTLILALLYGSYLMLWNLIDQKNVKSKICAVLGVIIAIDVPIVYKSVSWWRTLHQPPSLFQGSDQLMDPRIVQLLLLCMMFNLAFVIWIGFVRYQNLRLIDQLKVEAISGFD